MSHAVTNKVDTAGKAPLTIEELSRPSVFSHENYREFMKSFMKFTKQLDKGFNIARFAKKLGFSSHSGLVMILNGQRELKNPYLERFAILAGLSTKERLYFEILVRGQELSKVKRKKFIRSVELLTDVWQVPHDLKEARLIDYGLVHQVLVLHNKPITAEQIQQYFKYPLESAALSEILQSLVKNKIIQKKPKQKYLILKDVLIMENEVPLGSGKEFHIDAFELAKQSLMKEAPESREFQTFLLSVDSETIPELKKRIKALLYQVLEEFEEKKNPDTSVQVHFNMFEPLRRLTTIEETK